MDKMRNGAWRRKQKPVGTSLERTRDHLANERTLLAWVRTGVALIGLGFVVARFHLLLRESPSPPNGPFQGLFDAHPTSWLGTGIVILAALLVALSHARYLHTVHGLDQDTYRDSRLLTASLSAVAVVIAIVLAIYLVITSL